MSASAEVYVNCKTLEEFKTLMKHLEKEGYTWFPGALLPTKVYKGKWLTAFSAYKIDTVNKQVSKPMRNSNRLRDLGNTVLTLEEYLGYTPKPNFAADVCPECKGTKFYTGLTVVEPCSLCCPKPVEETV